MTSSYESWLPECNGISSPYPAIQETDRDYNPPVQARYAFDGGESPHSIMSPPRQEIEPWDEATRELRIVLHRHPVSPAFLQDAYKAAKKNHGQVRTVAVYVMHRLGASQSIRVLQAMGGFTKDETRNAGQGVCFVRDMRKQEPKPKVEPKPEPEPKELNWSERELQITSDAIKARRAIGVHETFLTGLLREQAEQRKAVDEQNAARDDIKESAEYQELCRQEAEIVRQLQELELKRGQACQS